VSVPLSLAGIDAHYGRTQVLEALSLDIGAGELVSLLGASGCGKTTTLRLVAGFLQPSAGTIHLGARDLTALPAHARDIGLVFQTYALFPHLSVRDNIGFGLKQRGIARGPRRAACEAMIERVGLNGLAERYPADLSGGQRQRVALARALVIEPPLLMFDEPLSNLDARLRVDMRVEIRRLQQDSGATALYVTHDQEEAFSISDRVAIMHAGRIMQLDRPEVLYAKPANAFVAGFVGFENRVPMTLAESDGASGQGAGAGAGAGAGSGSNSSAGTGRGDAVGHGASVRARLRDGTTLSLPFARERLPGRDFVFGARADGLHVALDGDGIPATVELRTYLGRAYQYRCRSAAGELIANGPLSRPLEPGTRVVLRPQADHCCLLAREDG